MTARERLRWATPALLAAVLPLASRVAVWMAASGRPLVAEPGVLAFQMAWAAMPFVALAALAVLTRRAWAEVALAMGAGLALTAALWAWATWDGVLAVTGRSAGASAGLGLLALGAPVALLSVMVTAAAVRAAFVSRPGGSG
ncbi:hypothetical protein [Rubrivirga sp.]|uniref:hypothetical protein n=1 Tax=Rubrivirga sp. TaxID=1885344 RepID=UPI003B52DA6A